MICPPCRDQHTPEDCIDSAPGRVYPHRHCACQHHPRPRAAGASSTNPAAPTGGQHRELDDQNQPEDPEVQAEVQAADLDRSA